MAHRYDRRVHDEVREQQVREQVHWHNQINKDLVHNNLAPAAYMANAINRAYHNDVIGTKTADRAHEIRIAGNIAKHNYKK